MLQYIIISSLFSYGMFTIQRPGFIMDFLRSYWKRYPKKLHETLFECGICVASLWGGSCFLYLSYVVAPADYRVQPLLWLPVIMVGASGLNAFLDRSVKAFEKTYNYSPPQKEIAGEKKWEYLMPYNSLRKILADRFIMNATRRGSMVVEIGGFHEDWRTYTGYCSYGHNTPLDRDRLAHILGWNKPYCVIIMGLAFNGDLRVLKTLLEHCEEAFIEYSDDGISRQQIELLTEGIRTRLVIPEFCIEGPEAAPKECGQVNRRKIIMLKPCKNQ